MVRAAAGHLRAWARRERCGAISIILRARLRLEPVGSCREIAGRGRNDWLVSPADYNYPQYLSDMTALIARTGGEKIDWVRTSMGGIIGMLLAGGGEYTDPAPRRQRYWGVYPAYRGQAYRHLCGSESFLRLCG